MTRECAAADSEQRHPNMYYSTVLEKRHREGSLAHRGIAPSQGFSTLPKGPRPQLNGQFGPGGSASLESQILFCTTKLRTGTVSTSEAARDYGKSGDMWNLSFYPGLEQANGFLRRISRSTT